MLHIIYLTSGESGDDISHIPVTLAIQQNLFPMKSDSVLTTNQGKSGHPKTCGLADPTSESIRFGLNLRLLRATPKMLIERTLPRLKALQFRGVKITISKKFAEDWQVITLNIYFPQLYKVILQKFHQMCDVWFLHLGGIIFLCAFHFLGSSTRNCNLNAIN